MENRMYADRPCAEGHHDFKFLLPLLFVPVVFGMMRGFGRHRFAHMQAMHGHGAEWEGGVPPMFAEWHRRAHAAEAKAAAAPQAPTAEA